MPPQTLDRLARGSPTCLPAIKFNSLGAAIVWPFSFCARSVHQHRATYCNSIEVEAYMKRVLWKSKGWYIPNPTIGS